MEWVEWQDERERGRYQKRVKKLKKGGACWKEDTGERKILEGETQRRQSTKTKYEEKMKKNVRIKRTQIEKIKKIHKTFH